MEIGEAKERQALVEKTEEVMIIKLTVAVTEVLGTKKIKAPNILKESFMILL